MVTLGREQVFSAIDPRWSEALSHLRHDVYHTPAYHEVPGFGREGEACVFVHQEGDRVFLWPYLLTPTMGASGCHDVTSVYGYSGPVSSPDAEFVARGWQGLLDHWRMQCVVSAFTRFHPILGNHELVRGLRDAAGRPVDEGLRLCGSTVSLDLTIPPEEQVRRYQKVLRQEIRKSRESGFVTTLDEGWNHVEEFVAHYRSTMLRRNSRAAYLVDVAWVSEFRRCLGERARLFVTKFNGEVAGALIAIEYGPFLHAHLTGINSQLVAYSPLKVLLDDVRAWGATQGLKSFHLGGGLGGRADTLYEFKRKFSPLTHEFYTGSWILEPARYRELEAMHRRKLAQMGIDIGDPAFFPIYRYQPELPISH